MNKYITHGLAFAAGAAVAVLATNQYYKKLYGERSDAEIEDMERAFERKIAEYEPEQVVEAPEEMLDEAEEEPPQEAQVTNPYARYAGPQNSPKPSLYEAAAKYHDHDLEEHLEEREYPEEDEEIEDDFVEVDDGFWNETDLDKEDLKYYVHDDLLVDSDGDIIPDPSVVVGDDALTFFDDMKDVVYIHAIDAENVFRITRVFAHWLEER